MLYIWPRHFPWTASTLCPAGDFIVPIYCLMLTPPDWVNTGSSLSASQLASHSLAHEGPPLSSHSTCTPVGRCSSVCPPHSDALWPGLWCYAVVSYTLLGSLCSSHVCPFDLAVSYSRFLNSYTPNRNMAPISISVKYLSCIGLLWLPYWKSQTPIPSPFFVLLLTLWLL